MSNIKGRYVAARPEYRSERRVNVHTEIYDSTSEFAADLKKRKRRIDNGAAGYEDVRTDSYSKRFQGVESYDEAMDLLQHGYMPLVDQVKASMKKLKLAKNNRAFRNSMVGFAPIVPNAIKGLPTSMVGNVNDGTKNKVFDIYYDLAISSSVDSSDLLIRGKALLEALMALELKGYRFNLYCAQSTTNGNSSIIDILAIKVKNSDTPLNLIRVAFPLVHPAFFRVFGFDWMDKSPVTRMLGPGRGSPLCRKLDRESIDKIYKAMFGYNTIYLSSDDVNHVINDVDQSLDDYIIDLANDESCPRDPTTYSESINFHDLMEESHTEKHGSGSWLEAMRSIGFPDPFRHYDVEFKADDGDLFGWQTSPEPPHWSHSHEDALFADMTENELEKELRKHINELREAHKKGRL